MKELCAISLGGRNSDQARALAGIYPDYFVREHSSEQLISQGLAHLSGISTLPFGLCCPHPALRRRIKEKTVVEVIYTANLLDNPFSDGREVYKVLLSHACSPALINITMKLVHSGK